MSGVHLEVKWPSTEIPPFESSTLQRRHADGGPEHIPVAEAVPGALAVDIMARKSEISIRREKAVLCVVEFGGTISHICQLAQLA
jgi:hypothetical protein